MSPCTMKSPSFLSAIVLSLVAVTSSCAPIFMRLPGDAARERQQISHSLINRPMRFDGFEVSRVDSSNVGMTLSLGFVKAGKQSLGSKFLVSRSGAAWLNVKCDVIGKNLNVSVGFGNVQRETRTLFCEAPNYTLELREMMENHFEGEVRLGNTTFELRTSDQVQGQNFTSAMIGLHLYRQGSWRASVDSVNPKAFLATDLAPVEHDALVLAAFSFASIRGPILNGPKAGSTGQVTVERW